MNWADEPAVMVRPLVRPLVRPPAAAGSLYPGDPAELIWAVDSLMDTVTLGQSEPLGGAYIVPHGGYRYSGIVAAAAYARLRLYADLIRRVVLLGPAHHVPVRGCVVSTVDVWRTPVGDVPIDMDGVDRLVNGGYAAIGDTPHAPEHSLELQLPFLLRALPTAVPVLPVLIGPAPPGEVADAVTAAAVGPGTVLLCSTDLSHHLDESAARTRDAATAQAVLDLAAERIGPQDACGCYAMRATIAWARRMGLRARSLRVGTSADTTGQTGRVVGYGSFAFER